MTIRYTSILYPYFLELTSKVEQPIFPYSQRRHFSEFIPFPAVETFVASNDSLLDHERVT